MAVSRSLLTTTPEPHQLAGSEHAGKDCRCLVLKKELGERWSQFEKCLSHRRETTSNQPTSLEDKSTRKGAGKPQPQILSES